MVTCFVTEKSQNAYSNSVASNLPYFEDSPGRRELDGTTRNSNSPFFDLRTIIAATDNFSVANKLGKGGFGSVYKVVSLNKPQNLHKKFRHEWLRKENSLSITSLDEIELVQIIL